MGYSIKDIEKAGSHISEHFERKSQEKGEKLANRLANSTSQGRGLWVLILWPSWLMILLFSGAFFKTIIEKISSINEPISWIGLIGGYIFTMTWYKWDYTLKHPFLSSLIGYFGTTLSILYLTNKYNL